jgi:hypothetical protein
MIYEKTKHQYFLREGLDKVSRFESVGEKGCLAQMRLNGPHVVQPSDRALNTRS